MEIRSFNQELQFADILFSRLFKNITIEKTINGKRKSYLVKCERGNRSRIFKNLQNPSKRGMYSYPMIIYSRTGISRDAERVSNLHNELINSSSSKQINFNLLAPNPINIEYTLTIISNLASDNDLIMGNFIPFFNSDLFVTCKHPKYSGLTYNSQVIMNDSITEEYPEELSNDAEDICVSTFNFTFKTYIFGGNDRNIAGLHQETKILSNSDGTSSEVSTIYNGVVPAVTQLCLDFHAVPYRDVTNLSNIVSYDMSKYFQDLDNGKIQNPAYDAIIWKIDENGVLKNPAAIH